MAPKSVISQTSAAAVLAEAGEWETIMSQDAETMLDVYLAIKSPHAYLAVRPEFSHAWRGNPAKL